MLTLKATAVASAGVGTSRLLEAAISFDRMEPGMSVVALTEPWELYPSAIVDRPVLLIVKAMDKKKEKRLKRKVSRRAGIPLT